MLTVLEFAAAIGKTKDRVHKLIQTGEIKTAGKFGDSVISPYQIPEDELEKYKAALAAKKLPPWAVMRCLRCGPLMAEETYFRRDRPHGSRSCRKCVQVRIQSLRKAKKKS
jgi:hypothetical protein